MKRHTAKHKNTSKAKAIRGHARKQIETGREKEFWQREEELEAVSETIPESAVEAEEMAEA